MKDQCKNCHGWKGIHHYQTMQCPVGGMESPIHVKQEYMTSTFEQDDDDTYEAVGGYITRIRELEAALDLSTRYLEHPDVLEVTRKMALSGDAVVERNRKALAAK